MAKPSPHVSFPQLLDESFNALGLALEAQHEVLRQGALAWQEKRASASLLPRDATIKKAWETHDPAGDIPEIPAATTPEIPESAEILAEIAKGVSYNEKPNFLDVIPGAVQEAAPTATTLAAKETQVLLRQRSSVSRHDDALFGPTSRRSVRFSKSTVHSSEHERRPSLASQGSKDSGGQLCLTPHACFSKNFKQTRIRGSAGLKKGATGLVDKIYTEANVDANSEQLQVTWQERLVVQPGSARHIFWDSIGVIFLMFDFIMLPLQFLSDEKIVPGVEEAFGYLMRVYWTLDIGMGFITGQLDLKVGNAKLALKQMALIYVKTTLALDVALVLADWITHAVRAATVQQCLRLARFVRLCCRLVCIVRSAWNLLVLVTLHVRSDGLLVAIEILKVMFCCLVWVHPMACGFYAMGRLDSDGWIYVYKVSEGNLWSRYIISAHWSMSQLTGDANLMPQNSLERTYATFTLLLAFVLAALLISDLTTVMTQLQLMTAKQKRDVNILQRFLLDNKVSRTLVRRILDCATQSIEDQRRTPPEDMVELLQELSIPLQTELHYDIYSRFLVDHPFFHGYNKCNPPGMRAVCHTAVIKCKTAAGDVLFSSGESLSNPQMYMLITGRLEYLLDAAERAIYPGECVNEAVLWTPWPQQIGTLRVAEEGQVLCIQADLFRQICEQYQTETFYPARYAQQFVSTLNHVNVEDVRETFDDCVDSYRLANRVFDMSLARTEQPVRGPRMSLISHRGRD
eukprot:TRINITY_DN8971_c0_g2_i1.p1 TRINITY_DN8971_c0_g2~~TRINITY_DN8971_c0_g2_i1.p1  ORF type:complete len:750 (+),score=103.08 TRINITY_DN8971_c0_g2_i1:24-2252(+)